MSHVPSHVHVQLSDHDLGCGEGRASDIAAGHSSRDHCQMTDTVPPPVSSEAELAQLLQPRCPADPRRESGHYELSGQAFAGKYLLMHGIGCGKYGKVYEGRDLSAGDRAIAVKVLPRTSLSQTDQKKAEREWVIAAKLKHPNVIHLVDVQLSPTSIFLVLELACGRALFDLVNTAGGLQEDRCHLIFRQILSGVAYCHAEGVYHRDLKLENILIGGYSGDEETVKITDFGLSKDSTMSGCNTFCGTLSYMAPEVADLVGTYDGAKVDLWSLGVILHVSRCCSYPFGHDGRGGEWVHCVLPIACSWAACRFPAATGIAATYVIDLPNQVEG